MPRESRRGVGLRSGALAVAFGAAALAGVVCLLFPQHLTTPELRARYPLPLVRAAIQGALLAGLGCGLFGVLRGRHLRLAALGIALSALAAVLGGGEVPVETPIPAAQNIGLDWFALTLFVTALLFVPIERGFPLRPRQPVFRAGFWTDVAHFAASHLFVGVTLALTLLPAATLFAWATRADVQGFVAAQPFALQLAAAVVVTDLCSYAAHRLFHAVPFLWRFHAIHHSSEALDWLAGSRLHLVDAIATRAAGFVPLYVLGFSPRALSAYLLLVSFQAVFIHANVRWRLRWIGWLLATPRFHHWHHAAEPEAVDKNFAIHLPVIDRLFGTYYQPERFPKRYGIAGSPVPQGFLRQVAWPFGPGRRARRLADAAQ